MKIASLTTVPDDPLKIIINSGTSEIIIRASSIEEKSKWVNSLRDA
jgi:oxysterol-binding protein 1